MLLPPQVQTDVEALSEEGNLLFDEQRFEEAIDCWQRALRRLPAPQVDWEAAMWLCASIGDAHFQLGQFENAKCALLDALSAPDGNANPFVLFRLGQTHLRLGDHEQATDFLLRAYMLDGQNIFDTDPEGAEALQLLESRELIKIV
jgi:tetratricopeptide (TPR) repeat protein